MPLDLGPVDPQNPQEVSELMQRQAKSLFNHMVNVYNRGSKMFWANPKGFPPEDIAAALGSNAKELFQMHFALSQFIESINPAAISEGKNLIREFVINEDGTVTVPPMLET